jgi:hypothetical protein
VITDDLAASNVNRSNSLAATSIAIFTFMLIFLYPRYASGEVDALLFQATIAVMGLATFSFAFASFLYYAASLGARMEDAKRVRFGRLGDRFWFAGYTLLFLAPSMILVSVGLLAVGALWFVLWLVFTLFAVRAITGVETDKSED